MRGLGAASLPSGSVKATSPSPPPHPTHLARPAHPQTPFISLTRWRDDCAARLPLPSALGWEALLGTLRAQFPSPNIFYALRVDASFGRVRARAVRRQTSGVPLAEVARGQQVFELEGPLQARAWV